MSRGCAKNLNLAVLEHGCYNSIRAAKSTAKQRGQMPLDRERSVMPALGGTAAPRPFGYLLAGQSCTSDPGAGNQSNTGGAGCRDVP